MKDLKINDSLEKGVQRKVKLVAFLNAYFQGVSGGDIRFVEIMKRLEEKKDIELTIVTSRLGKDFCKERGLNAVFKVTTTESEARNVIPLYAKRILSALLLKLRTEKGTFLYSTSDFLPDILPAFACKLRNRNSKWIVCIHLIVPTLFRDYTRVYTKNNRFLLPTFRRSLYFFGQQLTISLGKRWADQILVVNKIDKEYLAKKRGVIESKINVVKNGADYSHLRSLEVRPSLFDAIFLGRFHPQKGIFDLIRIWKLVCEKKPKSKLCIVGSGPTSMVNKIAATVKENKLSDNIALMGFKTDDEKFLLLKSSNIFLFPSYYESFSIVVLEAMACGLPVVAYDLPMYEDIYGENIWKVPLGDLNQFADVIICFLNNDQLRRTFGAEGQEFVQRYDWDKIAEKEYQDLTGKD